MQRLNGFQDRYFTLLRKIYIPADLEIHPEFCGHVEEISQSKPPDLTVGNVGSFEVEY